MSAVQFGNCPLRCLHHDGVAAVVVDGDGGGNDDGGEGDEGERKVGDTLGSRFASSALDGRGARIAFLREGLSPDGRDARLGESRRGE